jgi:hypothetical protein
MTLEKVTGRSHEEEYLILIIYVHDIRKGNWKESECCAASPEELRPCSVYGMIVSLQKLAA